MFEKMEKTGLSQGNAHLSMVFDLLKYHIFSFSKAEMVPFWEKGGILHLSYLVSESGDPNFFSFFYCAYCETKSWEV